MKKPILYIGLGIAAYLIWLKIKAANELTPGAAIPAAADSGSTAVAPSGPQVSAFDMATMFGLG